MYLIYHNLWLDHYLYERKKNNNNNEKGEKSDSDECGMGQVASFSAANLFPPPLTIFDHFLFLLFFLI